MKIRRFERLFSSKEKIEHDKQLELYKQRLLIRAEKVKYEYQRDLDRNKIYFEEYKSLRDEIKFFNDQNHQIEKAVVVACAGLYGWILTTTGVSDWASVVFCVIPIFLVYVGRYRCLRHIHSIKIIAEYHREIYQNSWEKWLNVKRKTDVKLRYESNVTFFGIFFSRLCP